jgi:hypothetical protein
MDIYGPLRNGDMVLRFGDFSKIYKWQEHKSLDCYVYYPSVKPPVTDGRIETISPWYWIEKLREVKLGSFASTTGIREPKVSPNTPINSILTAPLVLRDGDIILTSIMDLKDLCFDRMKTYIWNPVLAEVGAEK